MTYAESCARWIEQRRTENKWRGIVDPTVPEMRRAIIGEMGLAGHPSDAPVIVATYRAMMGARRSLARRDAIVRERGK